MSLNLIKTYLVDKPGQKHLIWLDKWESQGFEYSSGRLLNGRAKSNYALKGVKRNISKFCLPKNKTLIRMLLLGVCSVQERSWQVCLDLPHLLNVGTESFSYSWNPTTGTAPHVVKKVTGRFMVLGYSMLSLKSLVELDINSVIWPDWKVELLDPKIHNVTIVKPVHLNLMRLTKKQKQNKSKPDRNWNFKSLNICQEVQNPKWTILILWFLTMSYFQFLLSNNEG